MAHRVCEWCGSEFEGRVDARWCKGEHYKDCENCGKSFLLKRMKNMSKSCSKPCADSLTMKNKGVTVVCVLCNEEFTSDKSTAKFCSKDHMRKCAVCDTEFKLDPYQQASTCSKVCAAGIIDWEKREEKSRATLREKYGVDNASQIESVKRKKSETTLRNYGVTNPSQSAEVQSRKVQTNLERYGHENHMQSPESYKRYQDSLMESHGVTNVFQRQDVKEKMKVTIQERYGVPYIQWRDTFASKPELIAEWENLEEWLAARKKSITPREVCDYFGVSFTSLYTKLRKAGIYPGDFLVRESSKLEAQLEEAVQSLDVQYKRGYRGLISPLEVDFYFPEHKLAVEISPTDTHHSVEEPKWANRSKANDWVRRSSKTDTYHQEKFKACEALGVELLTYFSWMDMEKFTEMVYHRLHATRSRIPARKTNLIKLFGSKKPLASAFLRENHVLGAPKSAAESYALTYEGDIVAVASFSKSGRFSSAKSDSEWELVRMVFKRETSVTGGASKLIKAFQRTHPEVTKVITFSDNDLGAGSVYGTLGFLLTHESKPGLNFVHPTRINPRTGLLWKLNPVSLHRQGADRLLKNLPGYEHVGLTCPHEDQHENASCLPGNEQIVLDYGFLPVYDCGYRKWELSLGS